MKRGGPIRRTKPLKPKKEWRSPAILTRSGKIKRGAQAAEEVHFKEEVLRLSQDDPKDKEGVPRCQRCKKLRTPSLWIVAHHVIPRSRAPKEIKHDPKKNGVALCFKCHDEVHFGREVPDRDQWIKSTKGGSDDREATRSVRGADAPRRGHRARKDAGQGG